MVDEINDGSHVALLLIHGIGQRARYEDMGALLDALESFTHPEDADWPGFLRQFVSRIEPSLALQAGADIAFTSFNRYDRTPRHRHWRFRATVKAYEVHWSPVTARGLSAIKMAFWLCQQIWVPVKIWASTWRQKYRIRVGRLHYLAVEQSYPAIAAHVLAYFRRFQGPEGRRFSKKSNFESFSAYAGSKVKGAPLEQQVTAFVQAWDRTRLPCELTARKLLRRFATLVCMAGALIAFIVIKAINEPGLWQSAPVFELIAVGVAIAIFLATLMLLWNFLGQTFSDVRLWASFLENDDYYRKRREILDEAKRAIEHVVRNDKCRKVVIVAHSLGSSIAFDALRELGQYNLARPDGDKLRLFKITNLITMGSPIDKITYFFEGLESLHYRAAKTRRELRGDLAVEPFFKDKPRLQWTNFWDSGDLISDALYTPHSDLTSGANVVGVKIQNVKVVNSVFPSTIRSHVTYLQNETVVETIFHALFTEDGIGDFADQQQLVINSRFRKFVRFASPLIFDFANVCVLACAASLLLGMEVTTFVTGGCALLGWFCLALISRLTF